MGVEAMGVMTVQLKLGLGLGFGQKKKNSSSSCGRQICLPRSYENMKIIGYERAESKAERQNIYLRFAELDQPRNVPPLRCTEVARPIRIDFSNSSSGIDGDEDAEYFLSEARSIGMLRPVEPVDKITHVTISNDFWKTLAQFYSDKQNPLHSQSPPPYYKRDWDDFVSPPISTTNLVVGFLEDGRYILTWEKDSPGVLSYPYTNNRTCTWTPVLSPLAHHLPFINFFGKWPFFVRDYDPNMGHFHLLFTYDPHVHPLSLSSYFVTESKFQPLNNLIELPILCLEYLPDGSERDVRSTEWNKTSDFEFVYLDKRRFGLVLHKHCTRTHAGFIFLMVFEYAIIKPDSSEYQRVKPDLEIKTRLLTTRRFRYSVKQDYEQQLNGVWHPSRRNKKLKLATTVKDEDRNIQKIHSTWHVHLTGAFLL